MATVHVRKLDEETVKQLKLRAARNNRSLEGEVREILERVAEDEFNMKEKQKKFRVLSEKMLNMTRGTKQTPSEVLIREDRDRGHKPWMDY